MSRQVKLLARVGGKVEARHRLRAAEALEIGKEKNAARKFHKELKAEKVRQRLLKEQQAESNRK